MTEPAPDTERRRAHRAARMLRVTPVVLVLLVTAALRIWFVAGHTHDVSEKASVAQLTSHLRGDGLGDGAYSAFTWAPHAALARVSAWLHARTGSEPLRSLNQAKQLTPHGYRLLRILQTLFGVASVYAVYRIGRRLGSQAHGVVAALVLSCAPGHIVASTTLTPDILVTFLSALSLLLALEIQHRPVAQATAARFGALGIVLGLTAASKTTGALFVLPVLLWLLITGRSSGRLVKLLSLSIPLAVLAWWLWMPPFETLIGALRQAQMWQDNQVWRDNSSTLTVLVWGAFYPVLEIAHGSLLGTLTLLGMAGNAFRYLFLLDPGPSRPQTLLLLASHMTFVIGYACATQLFAPMSFTPLLIISSWFAASALATIGRVVARLVTRAQPSLQIMAASTATTILAIALAAPPGLRHVYRRVVPGTTLAAALAWCRLHVGPVNAGRMVLVEQPGPALEPLEQIYIAGGAGLNLVARLSETDPLQVDTADAIVFPRRALRSDDAAFYRERLERSDRQQVIEGHFWTRRGSDLIALIGARRSSPGPVQLPLTLDRTTALYRATLPANTAAGTTTTSLIVWMSRPKLAPPEPPRLRLDGDELALGPVNRVGGGFLYTTLRVPSSATARAIETELAPWMKYEPARFTLAAYVWTLAEENSEQ